MKEQGIHDFKCTEGLGKTIIWALKGHFKITLTEQAKHRFIYVLMKRDVVSLLSVSEGGIIFDRRYTKGTFSVKNSIWKGENLDLGTKPSFIVIIENTQDDKWRSHRRKQNFAYGSAGLILTSS